MIEHEDNELVRRCLEGNPEAFEVLVEKYQKQIFNVAYRMCHNYDDAKDITQAVFVKSYEQLNRFRPKYKFFSWIYRIAVNETLNHLKSKRPAEELDPNLVSANGTPEESYEKKAVGEVLQGALMDIGMEYQILIILKHLQNFSYKEIAYILDLPEKKVKSRLFTARQLLKEALLTRGFVPNEL